MGDQKVKAFINYHAKTDIQTDAGGDNETIGRMVETVKMEDLIKTWNETTKDMVEKAEMETVVRYIYNC